MTRIHRRALSLLEVIISLFLLSFVGLGVLSMAESAFRAQKRNEHVQLCALIAQSTLSEIREWAQSPQNYLGNWSAYNGKQAPWKNSSVYTVSIKCLPNGRAIDSPCRSLEQTWRSSPHGARTMPRAVVPVEVKVSWSSVPQDSVSIVSYIGEPKRSLAGATTSVTGPNPVSVAMNSQSTYSVLTKDAQGLDFPNLLYRWTSDPRYLSPGTTSRRDGRAYDILRDRVISPPTPVVGPDGLMIQCFAEYAGTPLSITPKALLLP